MASSTALANALVPTNSRTASRYLATFWRIPVSCSSLSESISSWSLAPVSIPRFFKSKKAPSGPSGMRSESLSKTLP
ncbi:hypothetical protein FR483_n476L [Paramecium bursaria Chlorella virus FR483]|uniref:Uncharacterized protein n476L n=1 Tax=Paramecium bursaria Chlorella virus FR483 TaxID=399781 RepID=A7J7I0_PBCVF|nr:hypothetical protein FR483_n476L [Paramecium bursaria Chlorella virus FR483]ABT15761.1 hypothetical protein FR483_n476L [Paramecium bursaria Chlorella virus FR483]